MPTIHIFDLMQYVSYVAAEDPGLDYILAVDGSYGTQTEIVEGIAHSFGRGQTRYVNAILNFKFIVRLLLLELMTLCVT